MNADDDIKIHLSWTAGRPRHHVQVRFGNGDAPLVRPPATIVFGRDGKVKVVATPSTDVIDDDEFDRRLAEANAHQDSSLDEGSDEDSCPPMKKVKLEPVEIPSLISVKQEQVEVKQEPVEIPLVSLKQEQVEVKQEPVEIPLVSVKQEQVEVKQEPAEIPSLISIKQEPDEIKVKMEPKEVEVIDLTEQDDDDDDDDDDESVVFVEEVF